MRLLTIIALIAVTATASAGPLHQQAPTPFVQARTTEPAPLPSKTAAVASQTHVLRNIGNTAKHVASWIGSYVFSSVQDIRICTLAIPTPVPVTFTLLEIDNRQIPTIQKK